MMLKKCVLLLILIEQTCASLKYIEAPMTIAMGGMDVDIMLFVKSKRFIEEQCIATL